VPAGSVDASEGGICEAKNCVTVESNTSTLVSC
jgi:hypothetical protein